MRLFLAIEPDATVTAALEGIQQALRVALAGDASAIRWTRPSHTHITLHFVGEVDAERLPPLTQALGVRVEQPGFVAGLGRAGCFPARGRPSTVWVGLARGVEEMQRVHLVLGERLRSAHVATEARPFVPHFTMGRVRDRRGGSLLSLRRALDAVVVPPASWSVTQVTLFSSDLSGAAPRYEPLHRIALQGV